MKWLAEKRLNIIDAWVLSVFVLKMEKGEYIFAACFLLIGTLISVLVELKAKTHA